MPRSLGPLHNLCDTGLLVAQLVQVAAASPAQADGRNLAAYRNDRHRRRRRLVQCGQADQRARPGGDKKRCGSAGGARVPVSGEAGV